MGCPPPLLNKPLILFEAFNSFSQRKKIEMKMVAWQILLGGHILLFWILMEAYTYNQCFGSVSFWCGSGSGSADPLTGWWIRIEQILIFFFLFFFCKRYKTYNMIRIRPEPEHCLQYTYNLQAYIYTPFRSLFLYPIEARPIMNIFIWPTIQTDFKSYHKSQI